MLPSGSAGGLPPANNPPVGMPAQQPAFGYDFLTQQARLAQESAQQFRDASSDDEYDRQDLDELADNASRRAGGAMQARKPFERAKHNREVMERGPVLPNMFPPGSQATYMTPQARMDFFANN